MTYLFCKECKDALDRPLNLIVWEGVMMTMMEWALLFAKRGVWDCPRGKPLCGKLKGAPKVTVQ